jgi:hypothetical protein
MTDFVQALHDWGPFYLLIGTSAATLVGLLFVALSLAVTFLPSGIDAESGARVFVTPSLVYLVYVLVIAALLNFPQMSPEVLSAILAVGGIGGVLFVVPRGRALRSSRKDAKLARDDWLWYLALPLLCYLLILGSSATLLFALQPAFILVAVATLLLTVAGVRNAWDLMLWIGKNR